MAGWKITIVNRRYIFKCQVIQCDLFIPYLEVTNNLWRGRLTTQERSPWITRWLLFQCYVSSPEWIFSSKICWLTMRWTWKWIAGRLLLAIEGGGKRLLGSAEYGVVLRGWCVPMGKWSKFTTKKWFETTNWVLGILIIPLLTIHLS